jgi:hypothetical protein
MDKLWWDTHIAEVRRDFRGDLATTSNQVKRHGLYPMGTYGRGFQPFGNSGAGAMALAGLAGARRILMLGYDCQRTGGKAHWHGDHPKGMGNAGSLPKWPQQFAKVRDGLAGVEIINCTRETALTCFPRAPLEECLAQAAA